jgi:hypothetical protein
MSGDASEALEVKRWSFGANAKFLPSGDLHVKALLQGFGPS